MSDPNPAGATLVDIYRRMTLIKQNDERFRALIKAGKIVAPYYSPRGQEAIPAAISVLLTNDDYICTIYRNVHDLLAKGVPMRELWAEYAGKVTGTCKGKGGPMHITHPASGVMVTTGIVGSSLPIANGLALAAQLRGESRVAVAYFGDGASNIGAFHESLNLAAVWKLPVIFVCQNNGYGEHTRYDIATSAARVSDRAASYQMPGVTVDGNDPCAVYAAARVAIERARAGGGPTLLEAMTFRFHGHVFGDADVYMRPGEKEAAMKKDPVPAFRARLIAEGHAGESDLAAIESAIHGQIDEAVEFALQSAVPDLHELTQDVLSAAGEGA
ncbi:MAG: thiamine pyrophosphate-dependent dehydrogenase E1 component subunit alpha [Steroidobacteraceae bacterium]